MLNNYLKIAWRNLLKDRQFAFLNLAGLATGLACALLIFLWVSDEMRMDKFNNNDDRLYQVMQNLHGPNSVTTIEYTPGLLSNSLSKEIPGIEYATTVVPASWFSNKGIVSLGDKHIKVAAQYIGKDYYNIFDNRFISGDKNQLLRNKQHIAISSELAAKLFGSINAAIGNTLAWDHFDSGTDFGGSFTVSSVFEKRSSHTTNIFDILFNYQLFVDRRPSIIEWGNSDPSTYILVKADTDVQALDRRIERFLKTKQGNSTSTLFLQKYSDRYLNGVYENGRPSGGRIAYVRLFSVIAVFILVIACINFMNLSTAKALQRGKEVGIKKVMGASRINLIFQYLAESLLLTFLAFPMAILLIMAVLPQFNEITGKQLSLQVGPELLTGALVIALITGIISGSYPAFYLSGFSPITALRGKAPVSLVNLFARKGLVIFQFALSAILIVSVLVIYRQSNFIQSKNLGYNRDNIISFKREGRLNESLPAFMTAVKNIPSVVHATTTDHDLLGDHGGSSGIKWDGQKEGESVDFGGLWIDYDFIETMGISVTEGRSFSRQTSSDTLGILLNEAAVEAMAIKDPVGKIVDCWGRKPIIGVVKNFNYESLYQNVKPCFMLFTGRGSNILVKLRAGSEKQSISALTKLYHQFNPEVPFEFSFLDDNYQKLYASEQRVSILSRYFAGLAIVISCLGLFGLAAFSAQKRQKEIGIRKVVGATVSNVAMMLSKDFLKMVWIAIIIAFPLSWWMMEQWLMSFAFRITIGTGVFTIAGGSILILSLLTVSSLAIRAAIANPVKSLRSE